MSTQREINKAAYKEYMRKPFTRNEKAAAALITLALSWQALCPLAYSAFFPNQNAEKNVSAAGQNAQLKGELKAAKDRIEKIEVKDSAPADASTQ